MNGKVASLKNAVSDFMIRGGISAEMGQNLVKESIHLHLLSALSDAGILRHVVFQGGTALRLCYGGERYSEDLDFICGKSASGFGDVEFDKLIRKALEVAKDSLHRDFAIGPDEIAIREPGHPLSIKGETATVAAWQIAVPVEPTAHSPKSRVKIEFANVPSYEASPGVVRVPPGLVQIQDVILAVESAKEILADKAVALTARQTIKHRDIWDVWDLTDRLKTPVDRAMTARKFADYGTAEAQKKAKYRITELAKDATADSFMREMQRFLPARRVTQLGDSGLHRAILAASRKLLEDAVLDPA